MKIESLPKSNDTVLGSLPKLFVVTAREPGLGLKSSTLTYKEADARFSSLLDSSEYRLGMQAVDRVFQAFDFPDIYNGKLPYRLIFPADAFKTYLEIYVPLFDPGSEPVPAKDVFVVETPDGQGYLSRSSFWSAIIDGVSAVRNNQSLILDGKVVNVGGVQPCFRNEVKDVRPGWRELGFLQADIELAGLTDEKRNKNWFDKTAITQLVKALESINIPRSTINIRVNNFFQILYEVLGDKIGFLEKEIFGLDIINEMAPSKLIGNNDEFVNLQKSALAQIDIWLSEGKLSENAEAFLIALINTGNYDEQLLKNYYPKAFESLQNLNKIVEDIQRESPDLKISIDPLSVRAGTPGYDGTTMQADVISNDKVFPELAGGGAYQKAAQKSWETQFDETPPENFYMVGFALGLPRLNTVLNSINTE